MRRIYCILYFICTFIYIGNAQYYGATKKKWNVGLNVGVNNYFGDVSNSKNKLIFSDPFTKDFYLNRNAMCQLSLGYDIFPYWNLKFNLLYGNLQCESNDLDLKFKSFYTHEFSLINTMDVLSFTNIDDWDLNIRLGAGVYAFNTSLGSTESTAKLQPQLKPFTYAFVMPFGIGFAYNINEDLKFTFDMMYRWVANDNLDGYPSDVKKFEGFSFACIGLQYAFDIPSIHSTSVRKTFKQSNNYSFKAMGNDYTHKLYRQKKQRGNLHPINNYNKYQRNRYNYINSKKYIQYNRNKRK